MIEVHGYSDEQNSAITAVIDGVFSSIPNDLANSHRQVIAEWEANGNTIPPYSPPAPPRPIDLPLTKRQVIAAMILGASIMDPEGAVTAAIGAIADPVAQALALNDWRNAPYYARDHALFSDANLLAAMGLSSAGVDALWALAVQQPK